MPLIIYTSIQVIGLSIDFCVFLFLVELNILSPLFANATGKLVGVIIAFLAIGTSLFRQSLRKKMPQA